MREEFPSYQEWKEANPEGKFQDYLRGKIEFERDQIPREVVHDGFDEFIEGQKPKRRRLSEEQERRRRLIGDEDE